MSALPWSSRESEIRTVFLSKLADLQEYEKNCLSTGVTSLEDGLVLKSPGGETVWS